MSVIWLNVRVGAGKSAVGKALTALLPRAVFMDGDDHAGPQHLAEPLRWRMAVGTLIRAARRPGRARTLIVAYPLDESGHARLKAACGWAHRVLTVVNIAPPLSMTLRGRSGRQPDAHQSARIRMMRSEGYHRRRFATLTLPNAHPPAARTARRIVSFVDPPSPR